MSPFGTQVQPIDEATFTEVKQNGNLGRNRQNRIGLKKIERELQAQFMHDENCNKISFEDWEYANKYIDFEQFEWSQENAVDVKTDDGEKLANYR